MRTESIAVNDVAVCCYLEPYNYKCFRTYKYVL